MASSTMWLYLGSAIALALVAIVVAGWSLFSDRARGCRRCCKCWYDMHAATTLRCPECGYEAKSQKHLQRTRRRWRGVALAATILLFAAFLAIQPKVQPYGYSSLTPVTVLIVLSHFGDAQWAEGGLAYHMRYDLFHRPRIENWYDPNDPARGQAMWQWQWRVLARRALDRMSVEDVPWPRRGTYQAWLAAGRDLGGDANLRDACIEMLVRDLTHVDQSIRRNAAWYTGDHADIEQSLQRMVSLWDDEDDAVRHASVLSVRSIVERNESALPALLDALESRHAIVRIAALNALGTLAGTYGHREDVRAAIAAAADDPDCDVRRWQLVTWAHWLPTDQAWEAIASAMRSDEACLRSGGYMATLRLWNEPQSIKALVFDGLRDEDAHVRRQALLILSDPLREYPDLHQHRDVIEAHLHDDDVVVRHHAAMILNRLDAQ